MILRTIVQRNISDRATCPTLIHSVQKPVKCELAHALWWPKGSRHGFGVIFIIMRWISAGPFSLFAAQHFFWRSIVFLHFYMVSAISRSPISDPIIRKTCFFLDRDVGNRGLWRYAPTNNLWPFPGDLRDFYRLIFDNCYDRYGL